jgi:hypothetical protein
VFKIKAKIVNVCILKCKYVIIVVWSSYAGIKSTSTIWRQSCEEIFSIFLLKVTKGFSTFFVVQTVDEGV